MAERAVRWIVTGRVQGVAYRYFTRQAAQSFPVSGWVRNLYDGSVEVRVRGRDEDLEALRRKLRRGPSMARVDDIAEEELPASEPLPEGPFEIRF